MGRINIMDYFKNILWLNLKKLKSNILYNLLFIFINLFFLFSSNFNLPYFILIYFFVTITCSNLLYIIIRIVSQENIFLLLRSLGSSILFILIINIVEILFNYLISLIIFLPVIFIKRTDFYIFSLYLIEIIISIIIIMITSIFVIAKIEKEKKIK